MSLLDYITLKIFTEPFNKIRYLVITLGLAICFPGKVNMSKSDVCYF